MSCLICNGDLPIQTGGGTRRRYCSDKCRHKARAEKIKRGPWSKSCELCGTDFLALMEKQRFCSAECRYSNALAYANAKHKAFREANPIPDSFDYTCDVCQATFTKPHRVTGIAAMRGTYCEVCRVAAQRARYRKKTVARQSKSTKPSGVWFEEVLATYGSNCYLCQQDIDLDLPRTSKRGATVDHILPLSRGGQDELDNLRLVHWDCNRAKSNKLVEELNG